MANFQNFNDIKLKNTQLPLITNTQGECETKCLTLHKTLRSSLDVWEYPPGEFDWQVDADQSACVIAGSAFVDLADGRKRTLHPGTAMFLPRGLHGHWIINETLRIITVKRS